MIVGRNIRIWILMLTGFMVGAMTAAATGQTVTAPAGTHLLVQMTQTVNSRQHSVGHQFTARLEGDMVVNGTVVAPHGTRVFGRLIQARQAGRVAGRSELTLELTQMLINNQRRPIQTSNVQAVASSGSARNTAGRTARGAAVGGIIGDGAVSGPVQKWGRGSLFLPADRVSIFPPARCWILHWRPLLRPHRIEY